MLTSTKQSIGICEHLSSSWLKIPTREGLQQTSTPKQHTDLMFIITEILTTWDDNQLIELTSICEDRLKEAIEEAVHKVSFVLAYEKYFSEREHEDVVKIAERENRANACKLFLRLVRGKDSQVQRLIWKSFVKMHHIVPKLGELLKEIQGLGSDPVECWKAMRGLLDLPSHLRDVQQLHKETLRKQTEKLRVSTILMREKAQVFQLTDRYAELTVISTVRDRQLVEHELLARGRDHEEWREKHLQGVLEKIRTDQLFQSSFSQSKFRSRRSAAVAGVAGIGKTTMVQKIVYDWATGKIYQHFQFVFCFKFRDLNNTGCKTNLKNLILDQYPYFGSTLEEVWKNPEGLLFIFDGLDEFKYRIDFADSQPQRKCLDSECWCDVSDIVRSLIQHKLLPGCSVLVTTRPTALHLLEKAEISVRAEILGFVGEERKKYFSMFFEDQAVASTLIKHLEENDILYTMSYNPSYCWILGLTLGPFFKQEDRNPQQVPKTITQLYSYHIYNILKNHSLEIERPCDMLLKVGKMAFAGVTEKKIVFTEEDLIKYDLKSSQLLSGFLVELLERDNCARSVVYTFPHLTIQEFVAALAQFLIPDCKDILKFLSEAHSATDGRFEVFLRFVAGLSSSLLTQGLKEFLDPVPHKRICRVIDWVEEEIKRQIRNGNKKSLLNALHYLFESQNTGLARDALESVQTLSFCGLRLTPIDCAVLSRVIGFCNAIKHLNLRGCYIQHEGLQRLAPGLHKCQELRLGDNELGDSGIELVSAALKNAECKIQKLELDKTGLTAACAAGLASALNTTRTLTELDLGINKLEDLGVQLLSAILSNPECNIRKLRLWDVGLTATGASDLASALSTNHSLTELELGDNDLGDSGVDKVSEALRNPNCKIQILKLWNTGLTDDCAENLVSVLSSIQSLNTLDVESNSFTDQSVPAFCRLIRTLKNLEWIGLGRNRFGSDGEKELKSLQQSRHRLIVSV
ncbi:NACHT, LRR and PYD domains-containing protein 3-like isoform X1 [Mobula birostris]|uniref:NACHT, LRR and PYD domains-containing protein 3-like isoform X1 n=1 Tax=Mobula birostris TaxID=1983395 RepID=UPI003B28284E